jgi:AAA15 family ATPase/GTPase
MSHINYIGIKNFRVFSEREDFEFAPITVLTGMNSSGKSSLVNALVVLKRYFNKAGFNSPANLMNLEPLRYLKPKEIGERLGDFTSLINNTGKATTFSFYIPTLLKGVLDQLEFHFEFKRESKKSQQGTLNAISLLSKKKEKCIFKIELKQKSQVFINYLYFWEEFKRESTALRPLLKLYKEREKLLFGDERAKINEKLDHLVDQLWPTHVKDRYGENHAGSYLLPLYELKNANCLPFFSSDDLEKLYDESLFLFGYSDAVIKENSAEALDKMEEMFLSDFAFEIDMKYSRDWLGDILGWLSKPLNIQTKDFPFKKDVLYESKVISSVNRSGELEKPLPNTNKNADNFFKSFVVDNIINALSFATEGIQLSHDIPSIRSGISRLYSVHREQSFLETTLNDFKRELAYESGKVKKFIDKYLTVFSIADSLEVETTAGVAHAVYLFKDDKKILLADLGYGISQILPIILKIGVLARQNEYEYGYRDYNGCGYAPSLLVIEEPETNLHPALQSKLADMFVEAYKEFNVQFIIETHSEYMIRKLQYLTKKASSTLQSTDTTIYYFYQPSAVPYGEEQIKKINITSEGHLSSDFGTGFFDESDKIAISLWNMNQSQNN